MKGETLLDRCGGADAFLYILGLSQPGPPSGAGSEGWICGV